VNCMSECVLNVLKGNMKLSVFNTCKLHKYKAARHKLGDRQVSL